MYFHEAINTWNKKGLWTFHWDNIKDGTEKMDFYILAKFWGVEEPQDQGADWGSETSRMTEKEKIQTWYGSEMEA